MNGDDRVQGGVGGHHLIDLRRVGPMAPFDIVVGVRNLERGTYLGPALGELAIAHHQGLMTFGQT